MSESSEAVKRSRDKKRNMMIAAMGHSCKLCGYNIPSGLVIHHIDPSNKKLNISKIRNLNINWEEVIQELRKCILLCANCHNEVHSNGLENYTFISSFNESYANIQTKFAGHLRNPESSRLCYVCNNILNNNQLRCCSEECRKIWNIKTHSKYNWNEEIFKIIDLKDIQKLTYKQIAEIYNVSDHTIAKYYKQAVKEL